VGTAGAIMLIAARLARSILVTAGPRDK